VAELEIWGEDPDGNKTTIGTATVELQHHPTKSPILPGPRR
jgi:hypothetical protein